MSEIKRINIKEFRGEGFLQEANRLFFHPLGLALEVIINEETKEEKLGGIWDYRDDPEGMLYSENSISQEKIDFILNLKESKRDARFKLIGGFIQRPTSGGD